MLTSTMHASSARRKLPICCKLCGICPHMFKILLRMSRYLTSTLQLRRLLVGIITLCLPAMRCILATILQARALEGPRSLPVSLSAETEDRPFTGVLTSSNAAKYSVTWMPLRHGKETAMPPVASFRIACEEQWQDSLPSIEHVYSMHKVQNPDRPCNLDEAIEAPNLVILC